MPAPNKIENERLVICEGRDAVLFIQALINNYGKNTPAPSERVQVEDFGGNPDLKSFLSLLRVTEGFENLKSLLIIRDAEKNASEAQEQVKGALRRSGFAIPDAPCSWKDGSPSVGYMLFPSCDDRPISGTLEDLCLEILKENRADQILHDVDEFIDKIKSGYQRKFARIHKTRLHTYLSTTDDHVSMKIGEAARAGAFNWHHERVKRVADFICDGI